MTEEQAQEVALIMEEAKVWGMENEVEMYARRWMEEGDDHVEAYMSAFWEWTK